MLVNLERIPFAVFLLSALLTLAGCQSCQETSSPPAKPAQKAAPQAKPAAGGGEQMEAVPAEDDEVDEDALVLLAEGDPEDGEAPLTVKFFVESLIEDEMHNPQYKWDFGDGSPISSEASPTHVYEKPGSYVATIRIVDGKGDLGWDEVDIDVEEPDEDE